MNKKELIRKFVERGHLITPELLISLESENSENVVKFLSAIEERKDNPLILTTNLLLTIKEETETIIRKKVEITVIAKQQESQAIERKLKDGKPLENDKFEEIKEVIKLTVDQQEQVIQNIDGIKILYNPTGEIEKISVNTFSNYFRNRYLRLREVLSTRPELEKLTSISKVGSNREAFSVIGLVQERRITKNGNVFLIIEDITGNLKVIITPKNKELFEKAENLAYDEVVGVTGWGNNMFLFANDIIQPDFLSKEKKSGGKGYALFISDLHIGSTNFMEKEFKSFIRWLNLQVDGNQKEIAEKCKYLFVIGDVVDGVGVYPSQEKELLIKDLKEQYDHAAYLFSQIRDDIKIIMIPGNHDASREAHPQPILDEKYASSFHKLKNVLLLTNPSLVNIGSEDKFEGYDILLYHGHSLNYYANNIKGLINKGYKDPQLLLTYLLKRRHLAPTHGSTPYLPLKQDPLAINKAPDVLAIGELHHLSAKYSNNIALITCSCWQSKTGYQIKAGHDPDFCKVPALDLEKNTIKILDFN